MSKIGIMNFLFLNDKYDLEYTLIQHSDTVYRCVFKGLKDATENFALTIQFEFEAPMHLVDVTYNNCIGEGANVLVQALLCTDILTQEFGITHSA